MCGQLSCQHPQIERLLSNYQKVSEEKLAIIKRLHAKKMLF